MAELRIPSAFQNSSEPFRQICYISRCSRVFASQALKILKSRDHSLSPPCRMHSLFGSIGNRMDFIPFPQHSIRNHVQYRNWVVVRFGWGIAGCSLETCSGVNVKSDKAAGMGSTTQHDRAPGQVFGDARRYSTFLLPSEGTFRSSTRALSRRHNSEIRHAGLRLSDPELQERPGGHGPGTGSGFRAVAHSNHAVHSRVGGSHPASSPNEARGAQFVPLSPRPFVPGASTEFPEQTVLRPSVQRRFRKAN